MDKEGKNCCGKTANKKNNGFLSGIIYGLIPHTGCIAFIIFTILGVTTATAFFKPLLLNKYFFHILIGLSFVFATISAVIYLKKNKMFSFDGIKNRWKYLSVLYGTTIGVNLVLFMLIFPLAANMTTAMPTGSVVSESSSEMTLQVDIPCPGHAPLITEELKTINGIHSIKFRFPNYFDVSFDSSLTSQKVITGLSVFNTYKATISGNTEVEKATQNVPRGCSTCGSCSGACGGSCGGY